jgi:NAD(P)-dependent dehydrogenase (short-subunit alcohol dehydrogenase family)
MKSIIRLAAILLTLSATAAQADTVLITGANRGLGLEFTKQYAERGYSVIATARDPGKATDLKALAAKHKAISVEQLDVLDEKSVAALAAKYKGKPIDLLLNNAGIHGDGPGQTFGTLNRDTFNQVMETNLFGVLLMTQTFVDNVAASKQKKIISVTSPAGSFTPRPPIKVEAGKETLPAERAKSTGVISQLFYSASKVSLNLTMQRLRPQLKKQGIAVGLIAPYTVETDMLAEVGYNRPAVSVQDGVAGLIKAIDSVTLDGQLKPIGDDGYVMEW